MKRVCLIPNANKDLNLDITARVAQKLHSLGIEVFLENTYASLGLDFINYYTDFQQECELIIVIGGDGSMLDASVLATKYDIPLLGVNLGKVGYLNELEPDALDTLSNLVTGEYEIHEKMLLSATYLGKEACESDRFALNDIVLSHENYLGIADFTLSSSDGCVKYRADGLCISTPQGSTAYSLSAGGPIVSHNVRAIVVTPICPHSFFNRAFVFSDSEVLMLTNTGSDRLNISIDGRRFKTLETGDFCRVYVSEKHLKVVSFKNNNMLSALFKKIKILEDI